MIPSIIYLEFKHAHSAHKVFQIVLTVLKIRWEVLFAYNVLLDFMSAMFIPAYLAINPYPIAKTVETWVLGKEFAYLALLLISLPMDQAVSYAQLKSLTALTANKLEDIP